ncbi:MAG TPA: NrfD/PsrC family molybdoenzyme membrane anchor subunit [Candidatus Limnocylindrales bacterium]
MVVRIAGREIRLDRPTVAAALVAARTGLRAEIADQPTWLKAVFAGLTALIAIGAIAAALTVPPGTEVFNTTPAVEWGLLIATYVFLVVTTSGLCLVSSLGMVFGIDRFKPVEMRHVVLALLFLVSGFGVIALELHYPIRLVFGVILSPAPGSPMWWMGTVYGLYLGVLLFELVTNLLGFARLAHIACVISAGVACVAPTILGLVFGSLVARPFWQGSIAPIYLIVTAVLSGASVLGIVFVLVNRLRLPGHGPDAIGVVVGIRRLLVLMLGLVIAYISIRSLAAVTIGSTADRAAVEALAVGPLGPVSWIVRIGMGLLVPLALVAWPGARIVAGRVFVASWLIMIGLFVDRLTFVTAGQIAPATAASGIVSAPYASYVPSFDEFGIVLGAIAAVALIYVLVERFVDLSSPGGPGDVHGLRASLQRPLLRRPILGFGDPAR